MNHKNGKNTCKKSDGSTQCFEEEGGNELNEKDEIQIQALRSANDQKVYNRPETCSDEISEEMEAISILFSFGFFFGSIIAGILLILKYLISKK